MRNAFRALAIAACVLPGIASGQVPQFPQNLPGNTAIGRLGTQPGPSEAIPFNILFSQFQLISGAVSGPGTVVVGDFAFWGTTNGFSLVDGGAPGALAFLNIGTGLASSGGNLNLKPAAASVIGGINSITCATHAWLNNISTLGVPTCAQPAVGDISGWGTNVAAALGNTLNAAGGLVGFTNAFPNIAPTPTRAGDIIYWTGSAWAALAGNNSGTQFLTENASGVLAWATVSGTGTVTTLTAGAGISFSSGATCTTTCTVSAQATSVLMGGSGNANISNSATSYSWNSSTCAGASACQQPIATSGTISQLQVYLTSTPGSGKSYTFVLMKNGVATAVTCAVSNTAQTCSDVTDSVTVAAGDLLQMQSLTPAGTPTAAGLAFSLQFVH